MQEIKLTDVRYRPKYHIAAKSGWLNDPNGLVYFKGYYHVFFQHYPYDAVWGPMHWGHVRSKDLIHWETLPIALAPDQEDGCFSGSAIEYDGKLFLIYTAHYNLKEDGSKSYQEQNLAVSEDGINFTKYQGNPVIKPPLANNTENFRDPKIWSDGQDFYCIIGGQTLDNRGQVLLYKSHDIYHWTFEKVLATSKVSTVQGTMWECPDYFEINGQKVLVVSPQGIEPDGEFYQNHHENGYFVGQEKEGNFIYPQNSFRELDRGHDFYAAQTLLAPDGRRILIAWLDMWEQKYHEQADGWAGMLSFPREITIEDGAVRMRPIRELGKIRRETLLNESTAQGQYTFSSPCVEVQFKAMQDLAFEFTRGFEKLSISYQNGKFLLEKTGYKQRKITWKMETLDVQILSDASSIEIFIENGPVISERFYGEGDLELKFQSTKDVAVKTYRLEL
ncbi:sucrose-6-phosphate hydrolase [Ligilactobacillus equi]|uniref:glycoside hydrolase family 32 protein n=1 Tax=Ligilactobacillus equi TaxID=137357 RepID=UPI002ED3506F